MDKQIQLGIEKAIREVAQDIYYRSQRTVPVKTGELGFSGYIEHRSGASEVGYKAKHSAVVEFGIEQDVPITGVQITSDGKRYENKRVIHIDGVGFRVIKVIKARPGKFFLTNAVTDAFKEFKEVLAKNIGGNVSK